MIKQKMHFAGVLLWLILPLMGSAQNSVLQQGTWYKLSVSETGVHKITYNNLLSWGIDPALINPKNIAVYGNGNGMLPESPTEFRYNDLQENAIMVIGESDEVFDMEDFVLFYAEGPSEWTYNESSGRLMHETNLYSNEVYYFLNLDMPGAARIQDQFSTIIPATNYTNTYAWRFAYEPEQENLIHSGKMWFGDRFENETSINFPISIPNLNFDSPVHLTYQVAARSSVNSDFNIFQDGILIESLQIGMVNFQNSFSNYAKMGSGEVNFFPGNSEFDLTFTYDQPNDSAIGWLDYFTLQATCNLMFEGSQMLFSDPTSIGMGTVTQFELGNATTNLQIWNVTDPFQPTNVNYFLNGSVAEFVLETDSLLTFLAFKDSNLTPVLVTEVENQNLHGIDVPEMVIITAPEFASAANMLADFRESNDDLSVSITTPENIYNEFSSGAQDVTAIRDFMKYLFEKSEGDNPKYLLMLGDASVDYKDRLENNTNFIPIWESEESLNPVASYCSDDYFIRFTDNPFNSVAIGRIPAETALEAENMVQNIIYYSSQGNAGKWHNKVALIADDQDANLHFLDAEEIADSVEMNTPDFNLSKIYLDAYPQVTLPDGQHRYPQVNEAINQMIDNGVLAITYIGHGGLDFLAQEQVMTLEDIQSWNNLNKLSVFMTFTCAFGRLDDPVVDPLMMEMLGQENQGMAAIFTATRPTYAGANMQLNKSIQHFWSTYPEMAFGEIIKLAKNGSLSISNKSKFVLFGDPVMRIAIPLLKVETDFIKETPAQEFNDTLHPGSFVTLEGSILSSDGNLIPNYSGELMIDIYDIPETIELLGNDSSIYQADFVVQDSVIKTVTTDIVDGTWSTEFFLPGDMDSVYGNIKFSYYALSELGGATGHFKTLVGGLKAGMIDHNQDENQILVYPTIADDYIYLQIGQELKSITCILTSISGKQFYLIKDKYYKAGEKLTLDISNLPEGFYILRLQSSDFSQSNKIVIR